MADPNSNFDELASITLAKYSRRMHDNVTNNIPLLYYIKKSGGMREITDGGTKILENLRYGDNASFKWFSGYEELSVAPTDDFTAAEFEWKECNANVIFSGREIAINSGAAKQFDLIENKQQSCEDTMMNNLGAALFYSNTENDGKSIGGFQHLIADAPTTGIVGGINRATTTNAFWRNQYYDFSANSIIASASTMYAAMGKLWRQCSRNADTPNLIIMGDTYYGYYEAALQSQQRFMDENEPDAGFSFLRFKNAKIIYDPNCADERAYFLNLKYIRFRPHKDVNLKIGKPKQPTNQNATIIPCNWMGNMTCGNCSLQGVMHA